MFGFEKAVRSSHFTANRALGLRERLDAIPALKGRCADLVRLAFPALQQEMGFDLGARATWWRRLLRH